MILCLDMVSKINKRLLIILYIKKGDKGTEFFTVLKGFFFEYIFHYKKK